jgi:drug/metabolite transporter (DMT)-like permease
MRLKGDLILLSAAIIWGTAFVAQRVGAEHVGPFLFNGLRFLLAVVVLWPLLIKQNQSLWQGDLKKIIIPGLFLFVASAFQQAGLKYTSAGNAGFVTGLYVVFVPLILAIFLKHKIAFKIWIAAILASTGLYFLSVTEGFRLAAGDGMELIGAFFWAGHVIVIARLVSKISVIRLAIGQFLICGLLNLAFAFVFEWDTFSGISLAWPAIVYTGIFSIAISFTLQVYGQKFSPPSDAAIILSLEAVFALFFGYIILNEILTPSKMVGVSLMFSAMIISQLNWRRPGLKESDQS